MRCVCLGIVVLSSSALALGPLLAEQAKPTPPAEQYEALLKAQRDGQDKFNAAYRAATTEQKRQQVLKELGAAASPQGYTQDFLKLIQSYPKDPVAIKAFQRLLSGDPYAEATNKAAEILTEHHGKSEQMIAICESLRFRPCPAGEKLLRALVEKSSHRAVQGHARYALAGCLERRGESLIHDDRAPERDRLHQEAETLLEQVVKDYADLALDSTTLGKAADAELFELRNLAIGKVAPDINGEDIDGKPLKLSDYRGKVVLLTFWGTWCGPCMGDIPHERSLVKRLEGKPFVLLGIDSDKDRDTVKRVSAKEGITWRSWWDGGSTSGPIASQWNVRGWPTLYLLDDKGAIRYKGDHLRAQTVRADKDGKLRQVHLLDEAVDTLLSKIKRPQ